MMKQNKNIVIKRNGRLTKREVLRRMWLRGTLGVSNAEKSLSYVARRIGRSMSGTVRTLNYLTRVKMINATVERHLVIFY